MSALAAPPASAARRSAVPAPRPARGHRHAGQQPTFRVFPGGILFRNLPADQTRILARRLDDIDRMHTMHVDGVALRPLSLRVRGRSIDLYVDAYQVARAGGREKLLRPVLDLLAAEVKPAAAPGLLGTAAAQVTAALLEHFACELVERVIPVGGALPVLFELLHQAALARVQRLAGEAHHFDPNRRTLRLHLPDARRNPFALDQVKALATAAGARTCRRCLVRIRIQDAAGGLVVGFDPQAGAAQVETAVLAILDALQRGSYLPGTALATALLAADDPGPVAPALAGP